MRHIFLSLSIIGITSASGFSVIPTSSHQPYSKLSRKQVLPNLVPNDLDNSLTSRGGELKASSSVETKDGSCPFSTAVRLAASIYGTGGVIYILAKAIYRVAPIALEPFSEGSIPLTPFQLGAYFITCLFFAYAEGYKGFQKKFSPMVVSRSLTLDMNNSKIHHFLLGPFYSMGLFHAVKKRMILSWSLSLGIPAVAIAVKKLPYPWRNIIDAGVIVGLSWGCISIFLNYFKAIFTGKIPADPALPLKG